MTQDFDLVALYDALDARRQARSMTWTGVANEMPAVSLASLRGLRERTVMEADGVLQMLRWLDVAPESFVPGGEVARKKLPAISAHQVLRFDTARIFDALEAQRLDRSMSWPQVASEIGGVGSASLTALAKGGRTAFPNVMRMTRWLNRPAASFTRGYDR